MSPPSFDDLGKSARGVFNEGFCPGEFEFKHNLKSASGIEFKAAANHAFSTGTLGGKISMKHKLARQGVTITETVNNKNVLCTEISADNHLVEGLKLGLTHAFGNEKSQQVAKLTSEYVENRTSCGNVIDLVGRTVTSSAVFPFSIKEQGVLMGSKLIFDAQNAKLTHHKFAFGLFGENYAANTTVTDSAQFDADIWHKPTEDVEIACNFGWVRGDPETKFGLAGRYKLNEDTTLRAKVFNSGLLGVGATHRVKPGMKLSIGLLMNFHGLSAGGQVGGHQIGVGLEVDH